MKKVHIWLFITKLLFLPILGNSQEITEKIIVIDSVKKREKKTYTLRFGIDIKNQINNKIQND